MFSLTEWQLMQEACEHRARQWRDQGRRASTSSLRDVCETRASQLASIASRINREREMAVSIGFELDDEPELLALAR